MKKILFALLLFGFSLYSQFTVTTVAGPLESGGDISLDQQGNLYIADGGDYIYSSGPFVDSSNVYKLDNNGNLTVFASGFLEATGNTFDSKGNFYQADRLAQKVYKITPGGVKTVAIDSGLGVVRPTGLVFDSNDNLYICDSRIGGGIHKMDINGTLSTFCIDPLVGFVWGITIDPFGNLYASSPGNGDIILIDPNGVASHHANLPGNSNGYLEYFAPDSSLFVANRRNHIIYKVDRLGNVVDFIGGSGRGNVDGSQYLSSFSIPNGIALTNSGDGMYVTSAVRVVDSTFIQLNPSLVRLIGGLQSNISLPEIASSQPDLYPNPTSGSLSIETPQGIQCKGLNISIVDQTGREVYIESDPCARLQSRKLNLDVHELPEGSYSIDLSWSEGSIKRSFIKL